MKLFKAFLTGFTLLALFSCNKVDRSGIDPAADNKAAVAIADSFQINTVTTENDLSVDHAKIEIKKSALDKEFLLSANLLSQTPTPMFSSLQSRIVSFVLRGNKIYMLDVTKNNAVGSGNIPQYLLLAEFEILSDKTNSYVIDFNGGMNQVFTAGDMFASDDSAYTGAQYILPSASVNMSYLDEVKFVDQALFIRQVAQVQGDGKVSNVEVRYQLKPYNPDPEFIPVKSPGFSKVGYFEANPLLLKDGTTRLYTTKWNEKKPMVFAISANTPDKYRELVKSAVLYWNKVLGENKIQVIQLEDKSITAPNFNYNIIQWADFDAAGYAYADMQIDPRSGEVTSAQVFFPTAFIEANVPKRLRLMEGTLKFTAENTFKVGIKGFNSARVCERYLYADLARMEVNADITPEAMDKAMRDYVYEVIAHEVGHVLGLRHNFAGNLDANYDMSERKKLVLDYYKNMKASDGVVSSSSVMEYSRFEESSWNGDRLQQPETNALSYDDMAIRYLYEKQTLPENRPMFCTDSDIANYADCNMSDAGRSIVSSASGMYQFNLDSIAARIINIYISKTKFVEDPGMDTIPVSEVSLDAKSTAQLLGLDFAKLVSLFKVNTKYIAVRSEFVPVLAPQKSEIEALEKNYLQDEVTRLGGLEKLTSALPAHFDEALQAKFAELLNNPKYNSGTLRDGTTYSFSEKEKVFMKDQVELFSTQLKTELILNEIKSLSGETFSFASSYGQEASTEKLNWLDSHLTEKLAEVQLARLEQYAFSKDSNKLSTAIILKDGSSKPVELPVYTYPQNIRVAACSLLSNGHEAIDWAYIEKMKADELIQSELSILGDENQIDKTKLSKDVRVWLLNNKQLQSSLSN